MRRIQRGLGVRELKFSGITVYKPVIFLSRVSEDGALDHIRRRKYLLKKIRNGVA